MQPDIFKAYDVRATYPDKLNEDAAWRIGFASGRYLLAQDLPADVERPRSVVVSRDMRPHSESLQQALTEGLRAAGADVLDIGMCDTSFIYFAVNHLSAAGGIQVTASHNPINYNGFKLSGYYAKPIGASTGLNDIRDAALKLNDADRPRPTGAYAALDLWKPYREHVLQFLSPALSRPVKVFIDASNGMAGRMVPAVFDGVPNLEIVPLNFEITGAFVHEPNPLVPENIAPTQQGVKTTGAALGACFDGDADRCMLVDDQGEIIGCDHLTALLAPHFLKDQPAGTSVIYDLRSSKVVEETIRALGATPHRSRVGHVFMKALLRETDGVFGGELSGHFYFRDNFYADSGAIAFAAVLSMLGQTDQPLSQLIAPLRQYPQSGEINYEVEDKQAVLADLKATYSDADTQVDELDGVTIDRFAKAGWWFNVRASNTEPLLRFNAEARDAATLEKLIAEVSPKLGKVAHGH